MLLLLLWCIIAGLSRAAVFNHPHCQVVAPLLAFGLAIEVAAPAVRAAVCMNGDAAVHAAFPASVRAAIGSGRCRRRRGCCHASKVRA